MVYESVLILLIYLPEWDIMHARNINCKTVFVCEKTSRIIYFVCNWASYRKKDLSFYRTTATVRNEYIMRLKSRMEAKQESGPSRLFHLRLEFGMTFSRQIVATTCFDANADVNFYYVCVIR